MGQVGLTEVWGYREGFYSKVGHDGRKYSLSVRLIAASLVSTYD
jgi:hypothetical protein